MSAVYFDVCALIIMVVLMSSTISRGMTKGAVNRTFFILMAVHFLANAVDIWTIAMDVTAAETAYPLALRYISHSLYLFFHSFSTVIYYNYTIAITDTRHKIRKIHLHTGAIIGSLTVMAILLIINPFAGGFMFSFDENMSYQRSVLFPIIYVFSLFYVSVGTFRIIKYRKLFSVERFYALLAVFVLGVLAVAIQMVYSQLRIEMLGTSLALMYISIMVQRPEDRIDSVTGLMKYEAYAVDMKKCFNNKKHVTSIIINIANFNVLNGMLNYDGMSRLLKSIADIINGIDKEYKAFAEINYLDRGRFRIVIPTAKQELIGAVAEKVNSVLRAGINFNGMELDLVAYVCITRCPEDVPTFETLMLFGGDIHDRFPYTGKVMLASELAEQSPFGLGNELNRIIEKAITNKSFMVYYQPIYSTTEKRFVSAEALIRLKDEKHGFIRPDVFIVAAERSGAIHDIGEFVLEEVSRFIASDEYKRLGLDYIEVNLSTVQCMSPDISEKVIGIAKKYGVSPEKINLEITETGEDFAQNIMSENIEKLHEAGFTFSLDDYGTGYSNIDRIASLPFEIVKLDKSFVDFESDPRIWTVICNTVKMLKSLDIHIVVEGIETEQLVEKFTALGCDYIQGYYFSKPLPKDDFVRFIEEKSAKPIT